MPAISNRQAAAIGEKTKENRYNYLSPKLVKKPSWVKTVKLIPDHIEYLIQQ